MDKPHGSQIVLSQTPEGVAFDFPAPLLPASLHQWLRQIRLLAAPAASVVLIFAVLIFLPFLVPILLVAVLPILFLKVFRDDDEYVTSLQLVFGGEMARRDATRTRQLSVSGNTLIQINHAGETRVWNRSEITRIGVETSSEQEGVFLRVVLCDAQGRRFILYTGLPSAMGFLFEKQDIAWIASGLRTALGIADEHRGVEHEPLCSSTSTAICEMPVHVESDRRTIAESPPFSSAFSSPDGNNRA